ncbi:MAG: DUF1684 domain-containing protein [Candidatus Dadabacteria bacterium]
MKVLLAASLLLFSACCFSQETYEDSLIRFIDNYRNTHEVVQGSDRQYLQFYPADQSSRVWATFMKVENSQWLPMKTSGLTSKMHRVYGILRFTLHDTLCQLNVYQSLNLLSTTDYKNYLFLPFTDATTGVETYSSGRYIDLTIDDVKNSKVLIDFNKAYNPYCAYVSGKYNCPIPPGENSLTVAIRAGEKDFGKHLH